MKTRTSIASFLLASIVGIIALACSTNPPATVSVDKDISVAIYSTVERGDTIDTILSCLMEETVHISELLRYPDDNAITMPFTLSDTTRYAEITSNNLEKRIAICINGQVLSTPVVKMKIENGACSVMLEESQAQALFPDTDIQQLQ